MKANHRTQQQAALVGIGLDAEDGQKRLTRGNNFVLFGGSEETHGRMQETAVKLNEHLNRRGMRLEDASLNELKEICQEVNE